MWSKYGSIFFLTHGLSSVVAGPHSATKRDIWPSQSGIYYTSNCTSEQNATINGLLTEFDSDIQTIYDQISQGVQSSYGYAAYFRTDDSKANVTKLFRRIENRDRWYSPEGVSMPTPYQTDIIIQCINPGSSNYDFYVKKQATEPWLDSLGAESFDVGPALVLWPGFWKVKKEPTRADCPPEDIASQPQDNEQYLTRTQYGWLVHVMANIYLSYFPDDNHFTTSNCTNLPAREQVQTPQNYALFASCELS